MFRFSFCPIVPESKRNSGRGFGSHEGLVNQFVANYIGHTGECLSELESEGTKSGPMTRGTGKNAPSPNKLRKVLEHFRPYIGRRTLE